MAEIGIGKRIIHACKLIVFAFSILIDCGIFANLVEDVYYENGFGVWSEDPLKTSSVHYMRTLKGFGVWSEDPLKTSSVHYMRTLKGFGVWSEDPLKTSSVHYMRTLKGDRILQMVRHDTKTEQYQADLASEKSVTQKLKNQRSSLARQNKDLWEKVRTRTKATITTLEGKVSNLEEQLRHHKMLELKKKNEEEIQKLEANDELRKKAAREAEDQKKEADQIIERHEKSYKKLQAEVEDMRVELDKQRSAYTQMEKKQKKFDALLNEEKRVSEKLSLEKNMLERENLERKTKIRNLTIGLDEMQDAFAKSRLHQQREFDDLVSSKDDVGKSVHELEKAKRTLEAQVEEQRLQIEELDAKLGLEVNMQAMRTQFECDHQAKVGTVKEQEKLLIKQMLELKKKNEEEIQKLEANDELRKKAAREAEDQKKEADQIIERHEKSYKKLQAEVEDMRVELDKQRSAYTQMEKKQKKFDALLNEEKRVSEKLSLEKNMLERENLERKTKIRNLTIGLDEMQDAFAKSRLHQQRELDDLVSSKDDVGKSVHELEKAKRTLEAQVEEQRLQIEELDAKLGLEVNMQAMRTQFECDHQAKVGTIKEQEKLLIKQKMAREDAVCGLKESSTKRPQQANLSVMSGPLMRQAVTTAVQQVAPPNMSSNIPVLQIQQLGQSQPQLNSQVPLVTFPPMDHLAGSVTPRGKKAKQQQEKANRIVAEAVARAQAAGNTGLPPLLTQNRKRKLTDPKTLKTPKVKKSKTPPAAAVADSSEKVDIEESDKSGETTPVTLEKKKVVKKPKSKPKSSVKVWVP